MFSVHCTLFCMNLTAIDSSEKKRLHVHAGWTWTSLVWNGTHDNWSCFSDLEVMKWEQQTNKPLLVGFTLTQTSLLPLARTPSSKLASKESLIKEMIKNTFCEHAESFPSTQMTTFLLYMLIDFCQLSLFTSQYLSVDMNFFVAPRINSTANIWGFSVLRIMANTCWQNIISWLLSSDQNPFSPYNINTLLSREVMRIQSKPQPGKDLHNELASHSGKAQDAYACKRTCTPLQVYITILLTILCRNWS